MQVKTDQVSKTFTNDGQIVTHNAKSNGSLTAEEIYLVKKHGK